MLIFCWWKQKIILKKEVPMFDFLDGFDIEDWIIIGPLSEELADEKRERRRLERDDEEEEDY
jgi:hypothetical protein